MEAKLRRMQSVKEEADATASLDPNEECPFDDEKGLYSIRDSARNTLRLASVQNMPNLIAVNMLAADLARNLKTRIFDREDKAWLLEMFLCVMGYMSDEESSARRSIGQLHLRPTMTMLGQPELLSNFLGRRMPAPGLPGLHLNPQRLWPNQPIRTMTLLELYKQIACDLVYSDNPKQRAAILKRTDAPTINCWAHLWNQFVKDTFAVFRLPDKQTKVTIHKVRVNFEYTLDPFMMRLLQAHLAYDAYDLPDETNAAAFVERKMEQLAAASRIKNEKKEKKRSLPQQSTEVSYDDYQALLRDEGLAGDFRARAGSRDAIVSRPYCKPKVRPFWEHSSSMCGGSMLA
jgi:hypothetical protein